MNTNDTKFTVHLDTRFLEDAISAMRVQLDEAMARVRPNDSGQLRDSLVGVAAVAAVASASRKKITRRQLFGLR